MYTIKTSGLFNAVRLTAQHNLWIVSCGKNAITVKGTANDMSRYIAHLANWDYSFTVEGK